MPAQDVRLICTWIALIAIVFLMQWQIWRNFASRYPHLQRKYVPSGTLFFIPLDQFLQAFRAQEVRKVFAADKYMRWLLYLFCAALIGCLLMIPTILDLSERYF